jgi:hypothetical protein
MPSRSGVYWWAFMAGKEFSVSITADFNPLQQAIQGAKSSISGLDQAVSKSNANLQNFTSLSGDIQKLTTSINQLNTTMTLLAGNMQSTGRSFVQTTGYTRQMTREMDTLIKSSQRIGTEGSQSVRTFGNALKESLGDAFNIGAQISNIGAILGRGGAFSRAGAQMIASVSADITNQGGLGSILSGLTAGGRQAQSASNITAQLVGMGAPAAAAGNWGTFLAGRVGGAAVGSAATGAAAGGIGSMLGLGAGAAAGAGTGAAVGGLAGSVVPILGTAVGAVLGSLVMTALLGVGKDIAGIITDIGRIPDAFKAAVSQIMDDFADLQETQFKLDVAFQGKEQGKWAMNQAEKISDQSAFFTNEQIGRGMAVLQMAGGENLSGKQNVDLSTLASSMSVLNGGNYEASIQMMRQGIIYGNSRALKQIQSTTGMDLSTRAMIDRYGGGEEGKDKWQALGSEGQAQARIAVATSPEAMAKAMQMQGDYLETINGQLMHKAKLEKEGSEAFKKFGEYALPFLKLQNTLLEFQNGLWFDLADGAKEAIDVMLEATGIGDAIGTITEAISAFLSGDTGSKMTGDMKAVFDIITKIREIWDKYILGVQMGISTFGTIYNAAKPFINMFKDIGMGGLNMLIDGLNAVMDIVTTLSAAGKVAWDVIADPDKSIADKLIEMSQLAIVIIGEMLKAIVNLLATGIKIVIDIWTFLMKTTTNIIVWGVNEIIKLFVWLWNTIIDIIKFFAVPFLQIFIGLMNSWNKIFTGGFEGLGAVVWDGLTGILDIVVTVGGMILDAAVNIGKGLWDALVNAVNGALGALGGALGPLAGEVMSRLGLGGGANNNSGAVDQSVEGYKNRMRMAVEGAQANGQFSQQNTEDFIAGFTGIFDSIKLDSKDFQIDASGLNKVLDSNADVMKGIVDGIAGGVNAGIDLAVDTLAGNMADRIDKEKDKWAKDTEDEDEGTEPTIPPNPNQDLIDSIDKLGDTINGKNMSSKIEIFITQTFEGDVDDEALAQAGQTAEAAVVSALAKKGILPT